MNQKKTWIKSNAAITAGKNGSVFLLYRFLYPSHYSIFFNVRYEFFFAVLCVPPSIYACEFLMSSKTKKYGFRLDWIASNLLKPSWGVKRLLCVRLFFVYNFQFRMCLIWSLLRRLSNIQMGLQCFSLTM